MSAVNMKTAVVDFDKTLIRVDSTGSMLRGGFAFGSFSILFWGGILAVVKLTMPYEKQVFWRRKFRYALFRCIYKKGADSVIAAYAEKLVPTVNENVLKYVTENYDRVFVCTAAWNKLVAEILAERNIHWVVYGTEYNPDFKMFYPCWHSEKVRRLRAAGIEHFDVFTDSQEDRPLIDAGENVFLVKDGSFCCHPDPAKPEKDPLNKL